MLVYRKKDGKKEWEKKLRGRLVLPPLEYLNSIICIMEKGYIYTYYKDGKMVWKKAMKEEVVSGLIDGNKMIN